MTIKGNRVRKIIHFFSDISYTLYLAHSPLLAFIACYFLDNERYTFGGKGLLLFMGLLISLIVYSYSLYWVFEKNTNKFRDFLFSVFKVKMKS